jgi:transcriptional regulator with XRE-family HTH domain
MPHSRHLGALPDLKRREQVAKLRAEGLSLRQVGERLGVTKQAVASLLNYSGLRTGPRRMVNLCGRCGRAVGPSVGSVGKHKHELTCLACVSKDRDVSFGKRLRATRLAAGLTVAELAKRIGMEMSTLLYWELQGKRPKASLVGRLAAALGVDPSVLSG